MQSSGPQGHIIPALDSGKIEQQGRTISPQGYKPKTKKISSEFTYSTTPWASLVGHIERSDSGGTEQSVENQSHTLGFGGLVSSATSSENGEVSPKMGWGQTRSTFGPKDLLNCFCHIAGNKEMLFS